MNNKRREILKRVLSLLESSTDLVGRVLDEEQDSLDNTPENLMESEQYQKREDVVDLLEGAVDKIEEAISNIEEASE